jgi:hypothetical protein
VDRPQGGPEPPAGNPGASALDGQLELVRLERQQPRDGGGHFASWKMMPSVTLSPEFTVATPCRMPER